MSRLLEFHVIQNFAPSNLNRDDTGAPKEALFGGVRRARVSSQCWKRSIRLLASRDELLPEADRGMRTKRLALVLEQRLSAMGRTDAASRIRAALAAASLKVDETGDTQYLLFLGNREIEALARMINQHWDALGQVVAGPAEGGKQRSKKDAKDAAPPEVERTAKSILDGGKAVDVALFGRMLADLPRANQDAACQVAHAISTHRVEREFDYFTAVDDNADEDVQGAGMIGTVEFNSATLYRYAALDLEKLRANLQGDEALARAAVRAFADAFMRAVPSGKQNSFAAHNMPSFAGVTTRHRGALNLANAFERPVYPLRDASLSDLSVKALAAYEGRVGSTFGDPRDTWRYIDLTGAWPAELGSRCASAGELADWAASAFDN
jgi:CRISPR system Cascade subunit CasC